MILCHLVRVDLTEWISIPESPHIAASSFKVESIANSKVLQLKKDSFH